MATDTKVNLGVKVLKLLNSVIKDSGGIYTVIEGHHLSPHWLYLGDDVIANIRSPKQRIDEKKLPNIARLVRDSSKVVYSGYAVELLASGRIMCVIDIMNCSAPSVIKSGDYLYWAYPLADYKKQIANNLYIGHEMNNKVLGGFADSGYNNSFEIPCRDFRQAFDKDRVGIKNIEIVKPGSRYLFFVSGGKYIAVFRYHLKESYIEIPTGQTLKVSEDIPIERTMQKMYNDAIMPYAQYNEITVDIEFDF